MEKLSLCRMCLVENVHMQKVVNIKLRKFFERITSVPFETSDSRPSLACYMCYARLQKCYHFAEKCLASERILTQMLSTGDKIRPSKNVQGNPEPYNSLWVTPVLQIDLGGSDLDDTTTVIIEASSETQDGLRIIEKETPPAKKFKPSKSKTSTRRKNPNRVTKTDKTVTNNEIKKTVCVTKSVDNRKNIVKARKNIVDCNKLNDDNIAKKYNGSNKSFTCDQCMQTYTQKSSLTRHLRTHLGVKPYKCDICQRRFYYGFHLNTHIRTHTGEKPYKCEICQRSFARQRSLNSHINKHNGEKPYECDICQKKFRDDSNLNQHIRMVHAGVKPYKCDICQGTFKTKLSLKYHMIRHTGEKPYKCDICQHKFIHRGSLNKHIRVHTGDKPYKCEICQRCFSVNESLKYHIRTHTGEKPYECDVCLQRFHRKYILRKHVLSEH